MNIGEIIFTGRRELPDALKHRGIVWVRESDYPEDGEFEDGYPSDWACERIAMIGPELAPAWLVDVLYSWWETCSHGFPPKLTLGASRRAGAEPTFTMELSTGGWSGLESIIHAVEENLWLSRFIETRHQGGHYVIEVSAAEYRTAKEALERRRVGA